MKNHEDKDHSLKTTDCWVWWMMLALNVAMIWSTFVGLVGAYRKLYQIMRVYLVLDIAKCIYFGMITIGLVILFLFSLMEGEDSEEKYRWTHNIQALIGDLSIPALSLVGSILFATLTFLSIVWNMSVRRFTKYTRTLVR